MYRQHSLILSSPLWQHWRVKLYCCYNWLFPVFQTVACLYDFLHRHALLFTCCGNTMWRCGGRVKVILIKSCSLDPNAILVTIFLGRAWLTSNTAELCGYVGGSLGTGKDELSPLSFSETLKKVQEHETDTWWPEEGALCWHRNLFPYCLPQLQPASLTSLFKDLWHASTLP